MLFSSLRGYQRSWAGADLVAGLTLLVIAVPEQLATSRLAGMPPITGFYAFVAGTVVFALLGSNPQMSVGADSTIAPLFAAGVAHLALAGSAEYAQKVAILAVMVGILVALVSVLRLGWIAEFLSAPIITGFLCGVAVIIVAHQLPDFFGLPPTGGTDQHRVAYVAHPSGPDQRLGPGHRAGRAGPARGERTHRPAHPRRAHRHGPLHRAGGRPRPRGPRRPRAGHGEGGRAARRPLGRVLVDGAEPGPAGGGGGAGGGHPDGGHHPGLRRPGRATTSMPGRDFLAVGGGSVLAGLSGSFPVDASPPRTGAVADRGWPDPGGPPGRRRGDRPPHPLRRDPQGRPAGHAGRHPALRGRAALQPARPEGHRPLQPARVRAGPDHAAHGGAGRRRAGHRGGRGAGHARPDPQERPVPAGRAGPGGGDDQLDPAGRPTPTRPSRPACWPCCSPPRSGTPTRRTSASRWPTRWPGRPARRGSSCSTPSA